MRGLNDTRVFMTLEPSPGKAVIPGTVFVKEAYRKVAQRVAFESCHLISIKQAVV